MKFTHKTPTGTAMSTSGRKYCNSVLSFDSVIKNLAIAGKMQYYVISYVN